jgi:hypothetical protein
MFYQAPNSRQAKGTTMNLSALVKRSATLALSVSLAGAGVTAAAQYGLHYTLPNHTLSITTSDTPPPPTPVLHMSATTDRTRPSDRYIRAVLRAGGIPPCKWEDGYGQRGMCAWDDGTGDSIVNVPTGVNAQKRVVVLIER